MYVGDLEKVCHVLGLAPESMTSDELVILNEMTPDHNSLEELLGLTVRVERRKPAKGYEVLVETQQEIWEPVALFFTLDYLLVSIPEIAKLATGAR